MTNPLLEIRSLHQQFETFKGLSRVLNGVNFVVQKGEEVGLIGEAGCGKTTTMKCTMRILPMPPGKISQGEILLNGKDLLKVNLKKVHGVRGISMIFQDPTAALNPVFPIGQQLTDVAKYSLALGKHRSNKKIQEGVIKVLQDVSMPDPARIMKNYPFQLSGGMRQRICIAKALIGVRDLLVADEPGTNLDVTIRDQILRLLHALVEDRAISVILISHAIGAVRNLANRVYVMYAGSMVEVAETKELFTNPKHPYTQLLLAAVPRLTGGGIAKGITGRPPDYLKPPSGCRFHPRCPHAMQVCQEEAPGFFGTEDTHKVACYLYR